MKIVFCQYLRSDIMNETFRAKSLLETRRLINNVILNADSEALAAAMNDVVFVWVSTAQGWRCAWAKIASKLHISKIWSTTSISCRSWKNAFKTVVPDSFGSFNESLEVIGESKSSSKRGNFVIGKKSLIQQ